VCCFAPSRAFPSVERLQEMTDQAGVDFVANPSGGDALAQAIRGVATEVDPRHIQISFCGPKGLLKRVQALMRENRIPARNINYEFFEFR